MNLLNRFNRILLAVIFTTSTVSGQVISELQELVLTGDLNGRSSLDFRKNSRNVQFTIPAGSQGTVLETRKLSRTGSYGVKIRLTQVVGTRGKNVAKAGDETWVYFSQKDPWLAFKDKEGSNVDDPEIALIARAKRDGEGLPLEGVAKKIVLPTKAEVLRDQKPLKSDDPNLVKNTDRKKTEADFCATCTDKTRPIVEKNITDLEIVEKELTPQDAKNISSTDKWSQYPQVMKYADSDDTQNSIKYGLRNKKSRSSGYCYRYVKRALLGGGLVDDYPPGSKARYGVSELKRRGFINMLEDSRYKNLIHNPEDAPKGAVLIYRNTRNAKHPGHIEIKTDWGAKGGYISEFYRGASTSLTNRELIGVMVKE